MCVTPSTNTCAIRRVRSPISTSAPTMQYGPISALEETRACVSTMADGWIAMGRLADRHRLFGHRPCHARLEILQHAHQYRLGHDHIVHSGLPVHLGNVRLPLGDL